MILTRSAIKSLCEQGVIVNNETGEIKVEPVSVMLHLDNEFIVYESIPKEPFVPPKTMETILQKIPNGEHFLLPPHSQVIACTQEIVKMPLDLMAFIQTRGSLARGFLMAHVCDGQIEPGYNGKITLEICNLSGFYYKLEPGMEFCSLFLHKLDQELGVEDAYQGRYQESNGPTAMQEPKASSSRNTPQKLGEK